MRQNIVLTSSTYPDASMGIDVTDGGKQVTKGRLASPINTNFPTPEPNTNCEDKIVLIGDLHSQPRLGHRGMRCGFAFKGTSIRHH